MDPNENIKEQRLLISGMIDDENPDKKEGSIDTGDAVQLAELARALDEWIGNGGFLPEFWRKNTGEGRGELNVDNKDPICKECIETKTENENLKLGLTEAENCYEEAMSGLAKSGSVRMITKEEITTKVEQKFIGIPPSETVFLIKQAEKIVAWASVVAEGDFLRVMTLLDISLELYCDKIAIEWREDGRTPNAEHKKYLKLEAELKKVNRDREELAMHLWNFIDAIGDSPRHGSVYDRSRELLPVARIQSQGLEG